MSVNIPYQRIMISNGFGSFERHIIDGPLAVTQSNSACWTGQLEKRERKPPISMLTARGREMKTAGDKQVVERKTEQSKKDEFISLSPKRTSFSVKEDQPVSDWAAEILIGCRPLQPSNTVDP